MHPLTPLAAAGPVDGVLLPVLALLWWLPYRARVRVLEKERRAVTGWRQGCFAAGLIMLAAAISPPVDKLADPHHLADTDPTWAGGDTLRIRQLARSITPPFARPIWGLLGMVPGPVAGAVRTGLDALIGLVPKGNVA